MPFTERDVDLGDVRVSIAEAGAGPRRLLLVHGFTGAKEDFTPWLDQLAELRWHAVAPDLRGHGASSKPAEESAYSFEVLADDVLRLANALGWDRFVLLGHSMGGMIAQFVARSSSARRASAPWRTSWPSIRGRWPPPRTGGCSRSSRATPSSGTASSARRRPDCTRPWHRRSPGLQTGWRA